MHGWHASNQLVVRVRTIINVVVSWKTGAMNHLNAAYIEINGGDF